METSSSEVPSRKARKMTIKFSSLALLFVVVLVFIIILCFVWPSAKDTRELLVQTKSGKIRGHYLTSYQGNKYEAYQGIPYALPPINERRFQPPVPIEPWSNELQATNLKSLCLQDTIGQPHKPLNGSEDCLYLNVYVPTKRNTNGKLPVIFYFHGGYFRIGGPREGEEQYLIDYDVIFVSVHYRLGVLGFLSTESELVSGNMGFKDQSTALRWTYNNIEAFGGNPKRIILAGCSTGGAAAHFHYLSAWSRGLFHAGISLSGSTFASQAMIENSREKAIQLARAINCTDEDMEGMVKCMKEVPAEVLVGAQHKLQMYWSVYYGLFGAVVENWKNSVNPFLDDYPSRILKRGGAHDVPWFTGSVSEEALIVTAAYSNDTLRYVDENWDTFAPIVLDYTYTIPQERHADVARKARKHYLGENPMNFENLKALTHLIGDRLYAVGMINAAKLQATVNKSPVFMYYYTYRATDSMSNKYSNNSDNLGVTHGDDLHLVVKDATISPWKSDKDMAIQRLLIKIWTSVAYNGVPNIGVKWPNINLKNKTCLDYIHIAGPEDYQLECSDTLAQNQFWNSIGFDEK